jgi:hypothetical protein
VWDRPIVVRWYELRNTRAWSVVQQGTLAPADGIDRWNSSIAMNGAHDVALGYAIANETTYPGIRYSARQPEDPPGVLRPEAVLVNGGGVQTDHPFGAWGLYSSMTVDPSDDCTFWYTNAYYAATSADDWSTRIGSFDLPNCPGAPAIASFAPASGPEGTTITIAGRGFVDVKSVKLSRKPMQFTVDSATQISARVPSGATSGPITVRTSAGTDTSASSFTVTP